MSESGIFLEIPFSAWHVSHVRNVIADFALSHNYKQQEIGDILVAVGEACTNAVKHGSGTTQESHIEVRCCMVEDKITISISNPCASNVSFAVPSTPDTERENGYGLYLMHSLMDSVKITTNSHHTTVVMTKRSSGKHRTSQNCYH